MSIEYHAGRTEPVFEERKAISVARYRLAVLWIDWYAYHLARYRALTEHPWLRGRVAGIELVGGAGVHGRLCFRDEHRDGLAVTTLFPDAGWRDVPQRMLAARVWRALGALDPEAVLVPGYYTLPGLTAAAWARTYGRRSILMSESTRDDHRRHAVREWSKSSLIRILFDRAIVGGKPHARYLESLDFPHERIATTYDTVDNDFFAHGVGKLRSRSSAAEYGLPEKYFLYVGRLAEEKNLAFLIDEFAGLVRDGSNWSLLIAGDGPLAPALKLQSERCGAGNRIHFCGMKAAGELLPLYAFADCFVLPSNREPWGLVVNEAMASALPVLVSGRCGCSEDLVEHGGNGYTFKPTSVGALRSLMTHVTKLNPTELQRMGHRSREIISQYSPQRWANEVVNCLAR